MKTIAGLILACAVTGCTVLHGQAPRPEPPSNAAVIPPGTPAILEEPIMEAAKGKPMGTIVVYGTPTTGGHTAGGGTYPFKTPVQISASPNTGWSLKSWNDGVTAEVRTVVTPNNTTVTYTATFIQNAPPPATNSLITVGWVSEPTAASYRVFQGVASGNYTNQWNTTALKLQISVPGKVTSYISAKSVNSSGTLSTNYSNEIAYTAP